MSIARRGMARFGSGVDGVTEDWIGWTFPPAQRAFEDAGWSRDDANAYCHQCGDAVGPGEATDDGCSTCREGAELEGGIANGVIRLGPYIDPLRRWIQSTKYQGWQEMGEALGRLLGQAVIQSQVMNADKLVVVPMPMPWQRRFYRGIDHSRVIAEAMAHDLAAPVARVLARANHPPQVGLTPSERKRAGARGLRVRRRWGGWPMQGLHLVLVDDVRTTGATLKAATRMLRRLKPERIVCAVVAVSDSKARLSRIRAIESQQTGQPEVVVLDGAKHALERSRSESDSL